MPRTKGGTNIPLRRRWKMRSSRPRPIKIKKNLAKRIKNGKITIKNGKITIKNGKINNDHEKIYTKYVKKLQRIAFADVEEAKNNNTYNEYVAHLNELKSKHKIFVEQIIKQYEWAIKLYKKDLKK